MKIAEKIERKINRMKEGIPFGYKQLGITQSEYSAAAKAIERFIGKGLIKRASTGLFYKPKQTVFGELQPGEEELLKPYLFEDGKRIAYITGALLYNHMGLTRQVPNVVKVASRLKRVTTQIRKLQVKPVKSYVDVTGENYRLLEILDALKDFKIISDLDKKSAITILKTKISTLTEKEQSKLLKYAMKYPPRARAFLGALFDALDNPQELNALRSSLNPLTNYSLGIKTILSTATNWNIN